MEQVKVSSMNWNTVYAFGGDNEEIADFCVPSELAKLKIIAVNNFKTKTETRLATVRRN